MTVSPSDLKGVSTHPFDRLDFTTTITDLAGWHDHSSKSIRFTLARRTWAGTPQKDQRDEGFDSIVKGQSEFAANDCLMLQFHAGIE